MKNLFKFAFVAFALTAFTACGDQGAATETEGTDTVIEDTTPADADMDMDMDMDATMPADTTMMMDSTTVVE